MGIIDFLAIPSIVIGIALLLASPISAQNETEDSVAFDDWAGVEEMVVTGTSMGLEIPTGTSVTGFDASDLVAIGAEDITDLAAFVPNLEIRTAAGTSASFFIRGVGLQDFGANATSAVAIFQDGVSINSPVLQLVGLFDLEGVTVLRGPQATGSNRNASAGAIKLVARKPSGQNEASIRYSISRVVSDKAYDAPRYEVDVGLGTSIIEDLLASRLAFRFKHTEPLWENGCGGAAPAANRPVNRNVCGEQIGFLFPRVPGGLPTRVGEGNEYAGRGQLRFQPGEGLDFILKLEGSYVKRDPSTGQSLGTGNQGNRVGQRDNNNYRDQDVVDEEVKLRTTGCGGGGCSGQTPGQPGFNSPLAIELEQRLLDRPLDQGPYRGDINRVGVTRVETFGANLSSSVEFEWGTVDSHTAYMQYKRHEDTDTDQTPNQVFEIVSDDEAWQFFQDLEVSGVLEVGDELRWDIGAYYLTEDLDYEQETFLANAAFFTTTPTREYSQTTQSGGVWVGVELDFWEDFTLEAGGRYNLEEKDFKVLQFGGIQGRESTRDKKLWKDPTWVASLSYQFTEDVSTYFKYSRGWKAGHFNANNARGESADPETLDAYEWGIDIVAWAERVKFNAQFFYYDYRDYQVFLLEDSPTTFPSLEVRNAEDAINFGAEAELIFQPFIGFLPEAIEGLKIEVRPGWLKTRFLDFTDVEIRSAPGGNSPVEVDFSGNPLPSAPVFQVSGSVEWPIVLQKYGTFIPRWDFTWTGNAAFDPARGEGSVDFFSNTRHPSYTIGQEAYATHNVRLDYLMLDETGSGFTLSGWCRNVTDERFKRYAADVSAFQKLILNFVGDPRTCGADISLTW